MQKKSSKKINRRANEKHPNLSAKFSLKRRADLFDQDYIDKLSFKEKAWLDKFNGEYNSDILDRKNPRKNLHKTKKLMKNCGDMNNSRNRDVLTREKASNQLLDYEQLYEETYMNEYENYLVQKLDEKDVIEAVEWLADSLDKDEQSLEDKLINELKKPKKESLLRKK
jgi:hypothetical protein